MKRFVVFVFWYAVGYLFTEKVLSYVEVEVEQEDDIDAEWERIFSDPERWGL